ncbi:MAG: hypothetical protein EOP39_15770 [Rubrivivax sp.]|nr:MAG: hypothetical protein EOP39_15770 [Rubrivivax sp.]
MSRRARQRAQPRPWQSAPADPTEDYGYDDEESCELCHGDGRDPYTDYLLPCPHCQGEQTAIAADRARRETNPSLAGRT